MTEVKKKKKEREKKKGKKACLEERGDSLETGRMNFK